LSIAVSLAEQAKKIKDATPSIANALIKYFGYLIFKSFRLIIKFKDKKNTLAELTTRASYKSIID
tara:strand:- start:721 stop:915 length:195 start_codon:yes stop_codon:yes gene_type:complete